MDSFPMGCDNEYFILYWKDKENKCPLYAENEVVY